MVIYIDNITYNLDYNKEYCICRALDGDKQVCECKINIKDSCWEITSWFTDSQYKNMGIGKHTMKELIDYLYSLLGEPSDIQYIWNGSNQYVYDWIKNNFNAVCKY